MSAVLRIANAAANKEPRSVPEFMSLFSARCFDEQERVIRRARETIVIPERVTGQDDYALHLCYFHRHLMKHQYNYTSDQPPSHSDINLAMGYFETLAGKGCLWFSQQATKAREGYDGGFTGLVDFLTDKLLQRQVDSYITCRCSEYLPSAYGDLAERDLRQRLADDLVERYGASMLLPNSSSLYLTNARAAAAHIDLHLEDVIKEFVQRMRVFPHFFE